MTRPPTFVVILLLLSAVWFVSSQPSIQVTVLLIAIFIILGPLAQALLRRGMQQVVRGTAGSLAVIVLPTTFTLNTADTRILGTMIESITIDQTEAWSGMARRMWLLWALPVLAALATMLAVFARRTRTALPGYVTITVCLADAICAQERPITLRLALFCMLAVQLVALAAIIGTYYGVVIG